MGRRFRQKSFSSTNLPTEEKRTRAFTDHDYFLNCYAKEMSQKAIVAEAKAILAAQVAKEGKQP